MSTTNEQIPLDECDRLEDAGDFYWYVTFALAFGAAGIRLGAPGLLVWIYAITIIIEGCVIALYPTGRTNAKDQP